MLRRSPRSNSRINLLRPLASLLVAGLSFATLAAAQSVPSPTYQVGANQNGSQGPNYPSTLPHPWVVSNGQIITPVGTQVYLGTTTRAKAIALNPTGNHTAAVLQMGAPQAVTIFNTQTGAVPQTYKPFGTKNGSPSVSPTRRMASTCCSARTAATLPSPAWIRRRACSQTTPTSAFRWTSTPPAIWPPSPASQTALQGPREALKSPAARLSRSCRMVHTLPIRPASPSRRMAKPLTSCWTTTIR